MQSGIILSVLASCLFGALYYFSTLLSPLNGEQIFGWRMLLTLPFVTAFLLLNNDWKRVRTHLARIRRNPLLLLGMTLTSALLAVQLFLFLWAPINGSALSVSLGYFLMPLTLLIAGQVLYRESLSFLQWLAAALAALGAGHELLSNGSFSWETAVVAIGYPLYFIVRKQLGTNDVGGMWFDMLLMLPVAGYFAFVQGESIAAIASHPRLMYLLPLLALLSAAAFVSYVLSAKQLPMGLFGLLGYVEPVLMIGVALTLGERLSAGQFATYGPIWAAVAVLVLEGALSLRKARTTVHVGKPEPA
ncbi:EamA family transporter RarD [Pseudomonas putida]|uniref:EamA family transporter RarD n=1 Tax=Pseudomonas putida TaxID=303 RepID=UPI003F3B2195